MNWITGIWRTQQEQWSPRKVGTLHVQHSETAVQPYGSSQQWKSLLCPHCVTYVQVLKTWSLKRIGKVTFKLHANKIPHTGLVPFLQKQISRIFPGFFHDFSRTQIDFSRTLKFSLTLSLPRSQCYYIFLTVCYIFLYLFFLLSAICCLVFFTWV